MRYSFGDFTLDARHFELRRGGELVSLEPKVFDILHYLVAHRDRIVSKDELLASLWPDEHVVDAVVVRCVYRARKALGQTEIHGAPLATVRGRGYRFTASVRASESESESESGQARASLPQRDPFVGRARVMERLLGALDSAQRGQGRAVLLAGEAGIGKTRAAEELAAVARARGVDVWSSRCDGGEGLPAFSLLVQLVRAGRRSFGGAEVSPQLQAAHAQLCALLPELQPRGAAQATPPRTAEHDHFRVFDAVGRMLRIACADRPRMLFVDDLQWADLPSLRLLGFVAGDLAERALLLVGTLREGELSVHDPRKGSLDRWGRFRAAERLALGPLAHGDVERYVHAVLGQSLPELSRALHARSEGNPFFMVEVLRGYAGDPAAVPAPDRLVLPDASRDIVRERLQRMPAPTRRMLEVASVLGRAFDPKFVAQLGGDGPAADASAALPALDAALQAKLLVPAPEHFGRLAFSHGLVREAIYDDLAPAERARLHVRVATLLRTHAPEPLSEIAYHLRCALPHADAVEALQYARRAGDEATAQRAHDAAAEHYAHALLALEAAPQAAGAALRFSLLLSLGQAHRRAGQSRKAAETFERAALLARARGDSELLARAALGLRDCQPLRAAPDLRVQALLQEAFAGLPEDEHDLRARLSSRLAAVRSVQRRREMSALAASLARHVRDPATLADVLLSRLHASQGPGEIAQRLAIADELARLATRHGEAFWAWEARLSRYDCNLRLGDVAGTRAALDACDELATSFRHPVMQMEVVRHRAQQALCTGRYGEAEQGILRALDLGVQVDSSLVEFHFGVQMAWLLCDKGLLEHVNHEIEEYMVKHRWVEATGRAAVGHIYLEKGEREKARQCLHFYTRERFENLPAGEDWVPVCAHLSVLCHGLREPAHAGTLYSMLAPYAEQNVVNGALMFFGSAHHFLGLLSGLRGEQAQALSHLERALASNERLGALPALVRTRLALADLLDDERADRERAAARETAESIGMHLRAPLAG